MLPSSRSKTRQHLNIQEDCFQDWICTVCCHCCPLTQELRELRELYPAGNPMFAMGAGPQQQSMQAYPPQQQQGYPPQQQQQQQYSAPPAYAGQPQQAPAKQI